MPLTPDVVAAMTKPELEELRKRCLLQLAGKPHPTVLSQVQTTLSLCNQAIKQLNVDQARRDKSAADRKRSAGLAEHQRNTARALGQASPLVTGPSSEDDLVEIPIVGIAKASPSPMQSRAPFWPKGITTRGECILMRAEQLRNQMRRLTEPLPYSAEFLPVLEAFCVEQKALVDRERAERRGVDLDSIRQAAAEISPKPRTPAPQLTPSEWAETWKDDRG